MIATPVVGRAPSRPIRTILLAGLIAGSLDITAAFIVYAPSAPGSIRLLQYIASGLIGKAALDGGLATALLGLVCHFFIATSWAALYVAASRRAGFLLVHPISFRCRRSALGPFHSRRRSSPPSSSCSVLECPSPSSRGEGLPSLTTTAKGRLQSSGTGPAELSRVYHTAGPPPPPRIATRRHPPSVLQGRRWPSMARLAGRAGRVHCVPSRGLAVLRVWRRPATVRPDPARMGNPIRRRAPVHMGRSRRSPEKARPVVACAKYPPLHSGAEALQFCNQRAVGALKNYSLVSL